jgi:hypothetical protein
LTASTTRNIIQIDLREHDAGGRHQIGTLAGFGSEQVAGFILECMAGFVGTRTPALRPRNIASRPMRARGSKPDRRDQLWRSHRSRPMRARGSKLADDLRRAQCEGRAPCGRVDRNCSLNEASAATAGRAPCGRVDRNRCDLYVYDTGRVSRPMRARGSKLRALAKESFHPVSRPMRTRGSKHVENRSLCSRRRSRPMRARGSKLLIGVIFSGWLRVAPHAGAWIETPAPSPHRCRFARRAPCGRVDRNSIRAARKIGVSGRAPCGRVDRNR